MLKNLIYNLRRFANEFTCDHVNSTHEWSDGEGWNILACTRCNRAVVFTESHRKTAILHSRAAELLRAADRSAIEMLRRFYDAWQSRADDRTIDELLVEMGAFLKTAGGA